MHVYSNYTISFYGEQEDIRNVLPIIKETFGYEASDVSDVIEIEYDHKLVLVECITADLAMKIAKKAPNLTFTIDGVVDASEGSGECMDFSIAYSDGVIYEASSNWHSDSITSNVPLNNKREIKVH